MVSVQDKYAEFEGNVQNAYRTLSQIWPLITDVFKKVKQISSEIITVLQFQPQAANMKGYQLSIEEEYDLEALLRNVGSLHQALKEVHLKLIELFSSLYGNLNPTELPLAASEFWNNLVALNSFLNVLKETYAVLQRQVIESKTAEKLLLGWGMGKYLAEYFLNPDVYLDAFDVKNFFWINTK